MLLHGGLEVGAARPPRLPAAAGSVASRYTARGKVKSVASTTAVTNARDAKAGGWLLAILPAAKLVLHLATFRGYGMFRDEFYYVACSDRLAAGYVDHPPLSILLLRCVRELLGDSLWALRLLPALAGAATVLLVGLTAREMGGGRFAQALAMTSALVAPVYLAFGHFYSMNAFDLLFWAVAAYLLVRFPAGGPGLWLALGVVLGLGLQNKISVLWLGFGLGVGVLCTARRRELLTPWPWVGALIALLLLLPHLFWQVAHGWPTLEFIRNATQQKMVAVAAPAFLLSQLLIMNPVTAPVWAAGLVWLLGSAAGRNFRLLGWTYLAVFALLAGSGSSRAGYLAPAYGWLLAAGGVAVAQVLDRLARPWLKAAALTLIVAGGALGAPLGLPLLPVETYIAYAARLGVAPSTDERKQLDRLPQFYADMHGWESIASTVAEVHRGLSAADREQSVVFAQNYGVAGAIEFLGHERGLPPAFSGHNNYWLWGPPDDSARVVIIVGGDAYDHRQVCEDVQQAGVTDCGYCMPYENHNPVFVCRGLRVPARELWPRLKHYD